MKTAALAAIVALLAGQGDEEKVTAAFKAYIDALRGGDFEKAADLIHPRSAGKARERLVEAIEKAPAGTKDRFVKTLEYKDFDELKAATPRDFFVRYLKHLKDLGEFGKQTMEVVEGSQWTIVGTVKKDDKVYVVVENTFTLGSENHTMPSLYVAYRDGETWKFAYRGETNIGK